MIILSRRAGRSRRVRDMADLSIGTLVRNRQEEIDDDDGTERHTPSGSLGRVVSVDDYPSQGPTYGVMFEETGGWVFYLEAELADCIEVVPARRSR